MKEVFLAIGWTRNGEEMLGAMRGERERRRMCSRKVIGYEVELPAGVTGESQVESQVEVLGVTGEFQDGPGDTLCERMNWGGGAAEELLRSSKLWFTPCCGKGGR